MCWNYFSTNNMVVTYALQKGMLVCSHYIVKIDGNILIVEGLQVTTKNFATDWPDDTWSKKVHCYEGNLLCRECLHCHNVSLDVHPMVHDEKKKRSMLRGSPVLWWMHTSSQFPDKTNRTETETQHGSSEMHVSATNRVYSCRLNDTEELNWS